MLFNTRDPRIHQRKKRIASPAFSAKGLQDFEPHMTENLRKLIDLFDSRLQISGTTTLDFNLYGQFLLVCRYIGDPRANLRSKFALVRRHRYACAYQYGLNTDCSIRRLRLRRTIWLPQARRRPPQSNLCRRRSRRSPQRPRPRPLAL